MVRSSVLWTAVLGACFAASSSACGDDQGAGENPGRGVYIRANWQSARGVDGHRVHVVEQRVACSACHDLTGNEVDIPSQDVCADCHEGEAQIQHGGPHPAENADVGGAPSSALSNCFDCHAFALEEGFDEAPPAWSCLRCHEEPQGAIQPVVVHASSPCETCHRPHETPSVEPSQCQSCHEVDTAHASAGKEPAAVCTTCHQQQHAIAAHASDTCVPCHENEPAVVPATALFEGHNECTGCHRPHDYAKENAVACQSCHEAVPVLGGGRVAPHQRCENCHSPHAVTGNTSTACASCHADQTTTHPVASASDLCATCHEPHPAPGQPTARSCSHCHQSAATDVAFHGGSACTSCHAPHGFTLGRDWDGCASCHAAPVAAAAGLPAHQTCDGCHSGLPHYPERRSTSCASCHGATAAKLNAGHQGCQSCHEPHGGTIVQECASCHGAVAKRAPAGHADCAACHEPHAGKVAHASCTSCHAEQNRGAHAKISGGCETCHSAHDARGVIASPGCTSCHAVGSLPALHVEPNHRDCATCHSTHRTRLADEPPVCLSCHADMKDHEPNAPRCSSCHLFE